MQAFWINGTFSWPGAPVVRVSIAQLASAWGRHVAAEALVKHALASLHASGTVTPVALIAFVLGQLLEGPNRGGARARIAMLRAARIKIERSCGAVGFGGG